ncbi:MAG: hypothetical protein JWP12_1899 [Bacteroidetes bacterium]|nr:hypothetical protein [Bacteroidota bacterium]
MNQEKINYRVARDFGETFNISIKFLRQNFKLFFQSVVFIAGPFLLLSAIASAFYQADALAQLSTGRANIFAQFGTMYFVYLIAASFSNLALTGTVFAYMLVYSEKGPGNFSVNDVARRLWASAGGLIIVFLLFTFLIGLAVGFLVIVFAGVIQSSPVLAVLLGLCLFVGMLLLMPPLIWQLSVVYLVKMQDNDIPFDAYGKTRQVMKGNYWRTWLLTVCTFLTIGIASFAFAIPQAVYRWIVMYTAARQGGSMGETSVTFLIIVTLCTFGTTLIYSVLYVISGFHYYSLAEKKDGAGLMERINEIGQKPVNNVEQQY